LDFILHRVKKIFQTFKNLKTKKQV